MCIIVIKMNKTISLDSTKQRIIFSFPYSAGMVSLVKESIPDRRWDGKGMVWYTPATPFHAAEWIKFVRQHRGQELFISGPVMDLAKEYREVTTAPSALKQSLLRQKLYPFQSECVDFIESVGGRCLLSLDQGLGKSPTSLVWAYEKDLRHILIVAPASVVYKWADEVSKWMPGYQSQVVTNSKVELLNVPVTIISYTLMAMRVNDLRYRGYDLVIADESQYLASNSSQRTKAMKQIQSKYFLALSGTPFLNRPIELFPTLHIISKSDWSDWFQFGKRYCDGHQEFGRWDMTGASNLLELRERLGKIMIRMLKKDVLKELPDMTRSVIPLSFSNRDYSKKWKEFIGAAKDSRFHVNSNLLTRLTVLRQIVGLEKVSAAVELAESILETPDRKVVLYAHHREVVSRLQTGLSRYSPLLIVGDVPADIRAQNVTLFQTNPAYRVMIISSAGGEGIDLYAAQDLIFVERAWNPGKEQQIEARLHRIGQKGAVTIHILLAKGTIDERMDRLVERKRRILDEAIGLADIETTIVADLIRDLEMENVTD